MVIEEGWSGPEVSVLAVCDGQRRRRWPPAQDFKRVGDGDTGPNTGGMGRLLTGASARRGRRRRDAAVRRADARRAPPARASTTGVLYAGLMLTAEGAEAGRVQRPLRRPRGPGRAASARPATWPTLLAEAAGGLDPEPTFDDDAAVTVVLATEGYPEPPRTGDASPGSTAARQVDGVDVLYAGVAADATDGW